MAVYRCETATVAKSDSAADAGWTMIELLVALVLMSLLTVLLMNSVYSSRRAIEQAELRDGEISIEVVANYLRHAISEAQPIKLADSGPDTPLIEGRPDQLRLITSYAPAGQFGGLYLINLERVLNGSDQSKDLVETRTLYRPQTEPGVPKSTQPSIQSNLLRKISNISFRYFGIRDQAEPPGWADDWKDPVRLPEMIQVRVGFPRDDDRKWSPLIVTLPVGR